MMYVIESIYFGKLFHFCLTELWTVITNESSVFHNEQTLVLEKL